MAKTTKGRPRSNSRKTKSSAVPVLFTLGVIGWGFFAIDRLTTPLVDSPQISQSKDSKFNSYSNRQKEKPFKEKVLNFIESVTGSDEKRAKKELTIIKEDKVNKLNLQKPNEKSAAEAENTTTTQQPAKTIPKQNYRVYFYQVKEGSRVKLKPLKRQLAETDENLLAYKLVSSLLRGPNASERMNDFTHSFQNKTRLIWAKRKKATLVLNFDNRFGRGVSFHLLRLQINQILQTSIQLKGINSISILIKGKRVKHLGGDGLSIPAKINRGNWSATI